MVHAALGEWAAARDPPRCHHGPLHRTVKPHRVLGVVRAGGVEAALTAQPARQEHAVHPDQADHAGASRSAGGPRSGTDPAPHESTRARVKRSFSSATRSCAFAPLIAERATSTMSDRGSARAASTRQAARRTRRARLRTTAPPTRRPATNATFPEPGATKATTRPPWNGRPCEMTRPTSDAPVRVSRSSPVRPRASCDPSRDASPGSRARPACACGAGTRGSSFACGCWVGRFAWTMSPHELEDAEAGSGRPPRVYGDASEQDKARDGRKTVKRPVSPVRVENPGAIFAGAFPPGGPRRPPPVYAERTLPRWVSTSVERRCG